MFLFILFFFSFNWRQKESSLSHLSFLSFLHKVPMSPMSWSKGKGQTIAAHEVSQIPLSRSNIVQHAMTFNIIKCHIVSQYVTICHNVSQCVTMCHNVSQCVTIHDHPLQASTSTTSRISHLTCSEAGSCISWWNDEFLRPPTTRWRTLGGNPLWQHHKCTRWQCYLTAQGVWPLKDELIADSNVVV